MKMNRVATIAVLLLSFLAALLLVYCVPPATDSGEETVVQKPAVNIDREKCDLYLNFAWGYYQNQNWRGAIKNYQKMLNLGCGSEYARDIYVYYGRAFQQLSTQNPVYYDSALYVFQEGEKYLPNDMFLRKNIAYVYHQQAKTDLEIRQYEKMIEIEPDNLELYRVYVKLCFSVERYEDVLWAVKEILRLSPGDEQAVNDRMIAYNKLGKDITTVQKEQWEKNPNNVRYGLEYAATLKDNMKYQDAIDVYERVASLDSKNREAWENLGRLYGTLDQIAKSVTAYEHINKNIAPRDLTIIQQITSGYRLLQNFDQAITWAQKAVEISSSSLAYKIRGDIYYAGAESCMGTNPITFNDKLVFKLAYDDYLKAYELGDYTVKTRVDYLKEYLIPTTEDWFMNRYDRDGNLREKFKPMSACYSWVKAEVNQ
jgi:tetratricopeptide (TPR) repeat protein